jgi:peptide deformylase
MPMIQKIVSVTDPVLRKKSKHVNKLDKKIVKLIKDLKDTLVAQKDPEGVGLAAPQIGKNVAVFAMKPGKEITIVINPEIISIDMNKVKKETKTLEGCLSLPHFYGPLIRPEEVTIEYTTESGKKLTKSFKGFPAQVVQHEIDHLNGMLFVDHLIEKKLPLYENRKGTWHEVELT